MNNHPLSNLASRREFIRRSAAASAVMTFSTTAPGVLCAAAAREPRTERILVVVEMAGGNDGLNTVIPHRDPNYRKSLEMPRFSRDFR